MVFDAVHRMAIRRPLTPIDFQLFILCTLCNHVSNANTATFWWCRCGF
jgi:hypothetical protein